MKFHPKSIRPLMYLSGYFGSRSITEQQWLKLTGCKFRCYSYAYTCPGAFYYNKRMEKSLEDTIAAGVGIMMDSSAFSFHKFVAKNMGQISGKKSKTGANKYNYSDIERLRDHTIENYVEFVKQHGKEWDFYINFDYIKHCPTIYKMQKLLEKKGIRPTPVYHGDHSEDWLRRYCEEGYKIIGIGSIPRDTFHKKRYYYDTCFNIAEKFGVKLHGLGQTSLSIMFQYPWYSVDSATWVKTAAYGKIIFIDPYRNVIGQLHISDSHSDFKGSYNGLPKSVQKALRDQIESYGFDFDKMRGDLGLRSAYNAALFSNHIQHLKQAVADSRIKWKSLI
jgi:hypothetical protein